MLDRMKKRARPPICTATHQYPWLMLQGAWIAKSRERERERERERQSEKGEEEVRQAVFPRLFLGSSASPLQGGKRLGVQS
jgi:hypothetical protein